MKNMYVYVYVCPCKLGKCICVRVIDCVCERLCVFDFKDVCKIFEYIVLNIKAKVCIYMRLDYVFTYICIWLNEKEKGLLRFLRISNKYQKY